METLGTRYSPTAPVNFRSGTLYPMIVLYHLVLIRFWASLSYVCTDIFSS